MDNKYVPLVESQGNLGPPPEYRASAEGSNTHQHNINFNNQSEEHPQQPDSTECSGGGASALPSSLSSASASASNDNNASELPPTYQVAAALPTYEEAELVKAGKLEVNLETRENAAAAASNGGFTFFALPRPFEDPEMNISEVDEELNSALLGNDFVFFTAFLTSFMFNWIGFLILMCFCHTIAARYGALSGFGLSLTKWTLIMKNTTDLMSSENAWLWWIIMAFGMLICMRAISQYLRIKKSWRLLSPAARERLFFFY